MKRVKAYRLGDGGYSEYLVPSIKDAVRHSEETWGRQYDPRERKMIEGGLPIVIERVTSPVPAIA